jgi:hypothetical protein
MPPIESAPPPISLPLLMYLEQHFPDRCARKGQTLEDIWLEAGARRVIEHLQRIHEEQKLNVLLNP